MNRAVSLHEHLLGNSITAISEITYPLLEEVFQEYSQEVLST